MKYIIVTITIVCILLMIFTANRKKISFPEQVISYVIIPMQSSFHTVETWVIEKINSIKSYNALRIENESLLEEVNELRYDNKILEQNKVELERLRTLYALDKKYAEYPKIGAQVIGKDPGNWYNVFIIDKGANDGLKKKMVVLSGNGLVGHIIEVGPTYSKVLSIIDDTSNVNAKILRTSDIGNLRGDKTLMNDGYCRLEYIDAEAHLIENDEVVTSHLGDIYPPGILIGTIKSISNDSYGLTQNAVIEPVVDFKHIEEVLVINEVWKEDLQLDGETF